MIKEFSIRNLIKRNIYILKFQFVAIFALVFFLLCVTTSSAQNNLTKSPALELLLEQVEIEYVPQKWNMNMDELARDVPFLYVELVGQAMFCQNKYLAQNPTGLNKFYELNEEIKTLIPQISNAFNLATNKYIDAEMLKAFYIRALYGESGQEFRQYYKDQTGKYIAQINFPYILDKVPEPDGIKRARKNAIVLLGEEATEEVEGFSMMPDPNPKYNGPKQMPGGCECPLTLPPEFKERGYFYLDCNSNPYDGIYVECDYGEYNGVLVGESQFVDGKRHGIAKSWRCDINNSFSKDCPHRYLSEYVEYKNGKQNGIYKEWGIVGGKRYLRIKGQKKDYKNHGLWIYYNHRGQITAQREFFEGNKIRESFPN